MLSVSSQRVAAGEIAISGGVWNGLIKVGGKVFDRVMPNGISARYQGNAYDGTQLSGCVCINLGGTAEVISFCPMKNRMKAFLFFCYDQRRDGGVNLKKGRFGSYV